MLLYFAATDPNEVICYKASDMVIHVDSDTSYISMPGARSWYARNFYLSNWTSPRPIKPTPKINGPIHTECKTIRNVVSSAAEAEKCGTSNNVKIETVMRPVLITLDHKQPASPLKSENSTTEGFVNSGMKEKYSKIWDMIWHWLRDNEVLEKLRLYWERGTNKDADCFKKHHPSISHRQMRPYYIHTLNLARTITQTIRLCKSLLNRFLCTQFCIDSLKSIRAEPQSMTKTFPMIRQLNRSRQYIMYLIDLSRYFNETHYNTGHLKYLL